MLGLAGNQEEMEDLLKGMVKLAKNQKRGNFRSVMFVSKEMVKAGVLPGVEKLNYAVKASCETGQLELALNQFNRTRKKGCAP